MEAIEQKVPNVTEFIETFTDQNNTDLNHESKIETMAKHHKVKNFTIYAKFYSLYEWRLHQTQALGAEDIF